MSIVLPEQIAIRDVAQLKEKLIAELGADSQSVTVDASEVQRIDTPAVQLLVSFHDALVSNKKVFNWENPSDAFLLAVSTLGICEAIDLPKGDITAH